MSKLPELYLIDTREQQPYSLEPAQVVTLPAGDYSLPGYAGRRGEVPGIAIERKTRDDLYGCCGHGHARFKEQLSKLSTFSRGILMLETDPIELLADYPEEASPGYNGATILKMLCTWQISLGIHVVYAESRSIAERMTLQLLNSFWKSSHRELLDAQWEQYKRKEPKHG